VEPATASAETCIAVIFCVARKSASLTSAGCACRVEITHSLLGFQARVGPLLEPLSPGIVSWWSVRLDAHWVHGRAGYRCRHGHSSAHMPGDLPRAVYWSERRILDTMLYTLGYQGELPLFAGVDDLFAYLRRRDLLVICGHDKLGLEVQLTPTTTIPRWDDSGGG
jgi:hypothetical protein